MPAENTGETVPARAASTTSATTLADLGPRAALVLLAGLAGALAPSWLAAPLVLGAAVVVVERAARHRRRGRLDAALVGVGAALSAVALLGLLLDATPWGLTRGSWAVSLTVLGVVVLAACVGRDVPEAVVQPSRVRPTATTLVSGTLAAGVLVVALVLAVQSEQAATTAPLQLSATAPDNGQVTVTVEATEAPGPLQLHVVTAAEDVVVGPTLDLPAGGSTTVPVTVPAGFEVRLQLRPPGSGDVVRELVVDGGTLLPGGS